jgi:hypothetical protein
MQTDQRKMLADRQVLTVYDALDDEFDLVDESIATRVRARLTQGKWRSVRALRRPVVALARKRALKRLT